MDQRPVCRDCRARHVCGGGCYADSILFGADLAMPLTSHCAFRLRGFDVATSLLARLREADGERTINLFGAELDRLMEGFVSEWDPEAAGNTGR